MANAHSPLAFSIFPLIETAFSVANLTVNPTTFWVKKPDRGNGIIYALRIILLIKKKRKTFASFHLFHYFCKSTNHEEP